MLSTPPAFILSQDQTLMLKFWFQSKFAWLILTVITVVLVLFWMFSWTSRLNQKPLFLEFSGFYILFSFQGSLLLSHRQLIYIIISNWLCQQLFILFLIFLRNPFAFPLLFPRLICPCLKDVCYDTRVSKDCQRFFYICYSFYFVVIFLNILAFLFISQILD